MTSPVSRSEKKEMPIENELRELDAEVHSRVMGIQWDATRCRVCGWPLDAGEEVFCLPGDCAQRPAPVRRADEPAHYSTDIAAAWLVAETFIAAGGAAWLEGDGHTGYHAGCTTGAGRFEAHADSPAVAICRAALDALDAYTPQSAVKESLSSDGSEGA